MQYRQKAADSFCVDHGWESQDCRNVQSLVLMQHQAIERSFFYQRSMQRSVQGLFLMIIGVVVIYHLSFVFLWCYVSISKKIKSILKK